MMCKSLRKYRSPAFSLRSVVRLALLFGLTMLISAASSAGKANAQVINYPSGFAGCCSGGPIWLENNAQLSGSTIQLVSLSVHSANNAWFKTPVNIQAFTTTFTWTVTCPSSGSGLNCGDGFGFEIICACTSGNPTYNPPSYPGFTFSGFSGGQFSWSMCQAGGVSCPFYNSVLVKYDLYDDVTSSEGNLTGYYTNGEFPQAPNNPQYDMSGAGINMQSGDLMSSTLTYNGTTLTEVVTDTVTGATYTRSYPANIPAAIAGNTAFVGFGGGTGAAQFQMNIHSWTYTVESPGQAAAPTFSPAAGTYSGSQSVTLSSATSGAVICYNTAGSPATNGSTSCSNGTLYTGPVTVSSSGTLYAVAGGTGYNDSPVGSASYVIQTSVATPTFSPGGGTYSSAQSVAISDATSNAIIYYTTDGTAPTASSTRYTGPILVSSTEKLEAIAAAAGETNSAVATAVYTITPLPTASTPAFSPASGTYSSAQSVTLSDATSGATIYYTTNGTTPTASSTEYLGPITVSSTEKLEAIALAPGNTNSAVASAAYTINSSLPLAATPTFSPAAGTYSSAQSVTLSDATSDATIYYTTNGTTPTTSSTEYTGPITVSSTETLEAIAVAPGDTNSGVASTVYTILSTLPPVATPTFSPGAGAYTSAQLVTLSDAISGAIMYYTTDGTTPTTSSTRYAGPITVSSTETLEVIAAATGDSNSAVASAAYTITPTLPSVATPTFSPAAGTYPSAQPVTISDASSDATIYYTTNGTAPTTASPKYTGPITVSSTETLEAIAVATSDSAIASAAYTITAQPNFLLGASASSLTVNPGGQGSVTLTVTPVNGFNSPVILACSGLPVGATCSFDQATVTPAGAAATTQLTISASSQSSVVRQGSRPFFPLATLAMTVGLLGLRKRQGWHAWLLALMACVGLGLLSGCGVSGVTGGTSPASSSTTSTVTVTAISGALQGKAAIALTVN